MLRLVILLHALYGLSFTLSKMMLVYAAPFFTVAIRMTISGIVLIGYLWFRYCMTCRPRKDDLWLYAQQIIFGIFTFYSLRAWGLQFVTATKASLLCNLLPFFTAVFSYFLFKERLSRLQVTGLAIGFIGTIPLLLTGSHYEDFMGGISFISWPELVIIIAVASLSYSIIVMQQLIKHRSCPPALVNGVCMFIGGIMTFTSSYLAEPIWIRGNIRTLALIMAGQIIISNLICSNLHAYLLKYYSATFLSFTSFLSPLFTMIYGYILLGETISWNFFLSFILVVFGLYLYHFREINKCNFIGIK